MNVGLYFGSFNPIHIGHVIVANYIIEFTDINKIWMIISPCSPFKIKQKLLDKKLRLKIVKKATKIYNNIYVSNVEFDLPQPSYTYKTLLLIKKKYPNIKFSIIMGYKNFLMIDKWKNYKYILENFNVYTYPEINYNNHIIKFTQNTKHKLSKAPIIHISSSFIREAIIQNKNVNFLLPKETWGYVIKIKNFYKLS
jgi:nicotinate-nucleotide adenylyltransferase